MCNTCPNRFTSEILDHDKIILLPYYREIVNYLPSPVAKANYTPYHLFCLKKNIMTLVREINNKYDITFNSVKYKENMMVAMQLYDGGFAISPDNETYRLITERLQLYIDMYPYCLLHMVKYIENKYNSEWLNYIYPYIATDIGIYNNGSIFVDLEDVANYAGEWEKLYSKVENTLDRYYRSGIMYKPNNDLIVNWNLKKLKENLYIANWDYRFTHDKIEFLYSKNKRMSLYLGDTKNINNRDGWLTLTVKTYQEVADLIEHII